MLFLCLPFAYSTIFRTYSMLSILTFQLHAFIHTYVVSCDRTFHGIAGPHHCLWDKTGSVWDGSPIPCRASIVCGCVLSSGPSRCTSSCVNRAGINFIYHKQYSSLTVYSTNYSPLMTPIEILRLVPLLQFSHFC